MATGDAAASAGMDLVNGSTPANTIHTEINKTRDYIAQKTNAVTPISAGGTGGKTAIQAAENLSVYQKSVVDAAFAQRDAAIETAGSGPRSIESITNLRPTLDGLSLGNLNPAIYNRGTSTQWRSLAIQSNGVLAQTASARRFKQDVEALDITDEQVAALEPVSFAWKADGSTDLGLIADDVEAILPGFVFHDEDGQILGIRYELLAVALIPTVQRLLQRVQQLEEDHGTATE